jgi:hypothetical protein
MRYNEMQSWEGEMGEMAMGRWGEMAMGSGKNLVKEELRKVGSGTLER